MSLSTQLTRGTLALPMLVLFGALALIAGESADAEVSLPKAVHSADAAQANATTSRIRVIRSEAGDTLLLVRTSEAAPCEAHARPQLLLAQAPADLGPMALRQGTACRA